MHMDNVINQWSYMTFEAVRRLDCLLKDPVAACPLGHCPLVYFGFSVERKKFPMQLSAYFQ